MERALEIAQGLLAMPTAPFHEDRPARFALDLAEATDGLDGERDAAGNVVIRTRGGGEPPLVLVAHLDHPGFSVDLVVGATAELSFRGGLAQRAALEGARVEFFRPGVAEPVGEGELVATKGTADRLTGASAAVLAGDAFVGDFAMWAFPAFALEDGRVTARACDDLVGSAAVLACLEGAAGGSRPVWGLLTRAEEVGLLGAFEAIRLGTVPADAIVLSLECSKALPEAPQGSGAIIRVGDRLSVFDPAVTAALVAVAAAEHLPHARRLMDGGVCEASAFCAAGYRASGLCIALGNYHNADDGGGGVAAEHVLVDDYLAEVALLDRLASTPLDLDPYGPWLAERTERARAALGAGGA